MAQGCKRSFDSAFAFAGEHECCAQDDILNE